MNYRPSRREFAVAGIAGLSGCLDWVPGLDDEEDPAREEMLERASSAENELLEDGVLVEYQNQDNRIRADTYRINVRSIEAVGIGEATEYRATGEIDLGRNIDDLPNYVAVDRDTLIGKLQEPAYDMFEPVIRTLERYREEERNVHQSRISEYGTMFHGRGDTYVLHYVDSDEIEDFDNREDYKEHFEENSAVWNGEEWV